MQRILLWSDATESARRRWPLRVVPMGKWDFRAGRFSRPPQRRIQGGLRHFAAPHPPLPLNLSGSPEDCTRPNWGRLRLRFVRQATHCRHLSPFVHSWYGNSPEFPIGKPTYLFLEKKPFILLYTKIPDAKKSLFFAQRSTVFSFSPCPASRRKYDKKSNFTFW